MTAEAIGTMEHMSQHDRRAEINKSATYFHTTLSSDNFPSAASSRIANAVNCLERDAEWKTVKGPL
jgi:hypothetical protein